MTYNISFVICVLALLSGCSDDEYQKQEDIAAFEVFLSNMNSYKNEKSIYEQGDHLFDAVLAIQRNHWSKAIKELTPYAEKKILMPYFG